MVNRRLQPVDYVPFKAEPQLAEGLIDAGPRVGGELLEKVSSGLFRIAAEAGQYADREALYQGRKLGEAAARESGVDLSVEETIDPALAGPEGEISFAHKGQEDIDPNFATMLRKTAGAVGRPLKITSGYRSAMHPVEAAKDTPGQHSHRTAVDIDMSGMTDEQRASLVTTLRGQGAKRFGTYKNLPDMLHVDLKDQTGTGKPWFMFNRSNTNMASAPEWFQKLAATGAAPAQRGARFSGVVTAAINTAAEKHGVPAAALARMAQLESGGNPNASNASGADGLFQLMPETAHAMRVTDTKDPNQSADAAARIYKQNQASLRKELGREPTPGEIYLAHQQGTTGAKRLLQNPNARAVDVVGAEAVRQNGGDPTMTAGQFAQMWIDKYEAGTLDRDSGVAGTGADGAVVRVAGGRFRPGGSNTIFGRAYDEAGSRAYLQNLDTEMRSTAGQLFEKYQENPQELARAYGELRTALKDDHVFPEIEGDFDAQFSQVSEGYLSQARKNALDKQREVDRGAFIERSAELADNQARLIAGMDPNDPNNAATIASGLATSDAMWDDAVARGIITPEVAATNKQLARREFATKFYLRQADLADAEGVEAMRAKMRKDFAAGGVPGMDADGFTALDAKLEQIEGQKRAASKAKEAEHFKTGQTFADTVAAGFPVDPAAWTRWVMDAGDSPEGQRAIAATEQKMGTARKMRGLSIKDGADHVAELQKKATDQPSDENLSNYAFAAQMQAEKVQTLVELDKAGDAFAARVAAGYEPDPQEYAEFLRKAGQTPEGKQAIAITERKMIHARRVRDLPLPGGASYVKDLQDKLGTAPSNEDVANYVFAAKALEDKRQAVATDPVSYAEQTNLVRPTPALSDGREAGQWAEIMRQRVLTATEAATKIGTARVFLKAGEAAAVAKAIQDQPELGAQIAAEIVAGAARDAPAVLAEFGADGPMIAQAGRILVANGDARAASDVLIGYSKDTKGNALPDRKAAARSTINVDTVGPALTLAAPQDRQLIFDAAAAISRAKYWRQGINPADEDDKLADQIYTDSLNEAVGGVNWKGQWYGGFFEWDKAGFTDQQVLVPSDIKADEFQSVIGAITDADLEKLAVKPLATAFPGLEAEPLTMAQSIQDATPVARTLPDGRIGYAFAAGDPASDDPQWIQGDDGNLFVLDLLGMKQTLKPRTPGAWRY